MSDMIRYHPGMIGDYTAALSNYSGQLDNIAAQARTILGGLADYFDTLHGSGAYAQVQASINAGIDEGRDVIMRHSQVGDSALQDFIGQDVAAANSFGSI